MSEADIVQIRKHLELIDARLEQLFEHLDIAPRGAAGGSEGSAGAIDPTMDPEIQDLVAKGNKIQAIKRYSEISGLDMKQAQAAIEALDS